MDDVWAMAARGATVLAASFPQVFQSFRQVIVERGRRNGFIEQARSRRAVRPTAVEKKEKEVVRSRGIHPETY
jgi:hypothetical protein